MPRAPCSACGRTSGTSCRACTGLHFAAAPLARNKPAHGNALGHQRYRDQSPDWRPHPVAFLPALAAAYRFRFLFAQIPGRVLTFSARPHSTITFHLPRTNGSPIIPSLRVNRTARFGSQARSGERGRGLPPTPARVRRLHRGVRFSLRDNSPHIRFEKTFARYRRSAVV